MAMSLMNYSNFGQVLEDFLRLNQAIEDIRKKIETVSGVSYKSQDARQVALEGFQCDLDACGNWIRALMGLKSLSQDRYNDNWELEYLKLIGTDLLSGQAEDLMLNYLRNTITTSVHFKIENLGSVPSFL
jgi:hypothetical protein